MIDVIGRQFQIHSLSFDHFVIHKILSNLDSNWFHFINSIQNRELIRLYIGGKWDSLKGLDIEVVPEWLLEDV